jgi:glycosyltransferase 2 family protein
MKRSVRVALTLVVLAAAVGYIIYKVDLRKTIDILRSASVPWLVASAVLTLVTVPPMAWRWQQLLRVRGLRETVGWLTRTYFVSYAWGQILPTSVGGDASRIYETSRRHPGQITPITGSVLVERAIGGAVTLLLAGVGFLLAIGRYPIGAYLWPEGIFVVLTIAAGIIFFSRSVRRRLAFLVPFARRLRIETPARAVYDGVHGYRDHPGTLVVVAAVTVLLQLTRVVGIYASGRAVGIHLPLLPYIVLGPLLFLVMLIPFTVNGIGVREAFFVSFLGNLGVDPDAAFACGFLFFVMTVLLALPGVAIILWESIFDRRTSVATPSG